MSLFQDLEDYKLQTEFDGRRNVVLHRSYRAARLRGRQRIVVEERWAPQKPVLGAGSFGTVRLERRQDADGEAQCRAVKQLRKTDMARMRVDFRKELLALTKFSRLKFVQSEAFVKFLGWFENDDYVYIAMEYFQHGTLDRFISEALSESDARIIAQQLLEGVRIMHEEHFTHRDLKPQNIFVVQHAPNWWVKIGDFGISKRVANDNTLLQTKVGTPLYLAPEVFHYVPPVDEEIEAYTNAVDVWSIACVVYEMLALQPPFYDWPRSLVMFCNGGELPTAPLEGRMGCLGIDFIKSVLVPLPVQRPTAEEALDLPWFQTEIRHELDHTTLAPPAESYGTESTEINKAAYSDSQATLISQSEEECSIPSLKRNSHSRALLASQPSKSIEDLPRSKSNIEFAATYQASPRSGSEPQIAVRSKELRQQNMQPQLHLDAVEGRKTAPPKYCDTCSYTITRMYYRCNVCNNGDFNLCADCVKTGKHCGFQDHWLLKCNITSEGVSSSSTEIIKTGWALRPIRDAPDEQQPPSPITLASRGWRSSYKKPRSSEVPFDYCFQCRSAFPCDQPPNRHEWEQHGTVDFPVQQADNFAKETSLELSTKVWMVVPLLEDQARHEEKLKTMEVEMRAVFDQKVDEKQKKMTSSEVELYSRHQEMSNDLLRQRGEWQERKDRLLSASSQGNPRSRSFFSKIVRSSGS